MYVKVHKNCENTGRIQKISWARNHFVKFDIYFLGISLETTDYIYLFGYTVFFHWKFILLNLLVDSVLILINT